MGMSLLRLQVSSASLHASIVGAGSGDGGPKREGLAQWTIAHASFGGSDLMYLLR